jgi:hypothetical protein
MTFFRFNHLSSPSNPFLSSNVCNGYIALFMIFIISFCNNYNVDSQSEVHLDYISQFLFGVTHWTLKFSLCAILDYAIEAIFGDHMTTSQHYRFLMRVADLLPHGTYKHRVILIFRLIHCER